MHQLGSVSEKLLSRVFLQALIDIVGLWGSIAASIAVFYPVNRTAALLLLPHLGWVSFATILNFDIWRLNRETTKKSA